MRIQCLMQNKSCHNLIFLKSLTEEVYSKSTPWFVNFPNCTPGSRTVLKWLYTPAKTQNIQGHHYNTGSNREIQRWQAERKLEINNRARYAPVPPFRSALLCWHTLPKDCFSEMRICRESRWSTHRTAIWIKVNLWVCLIQALQASQRQKSCSLCRFTHSCCFPWCQEHRAHVLRQ